MPAIDEYLIGMLEEKGSDLHLKIGHPPGFRIHGQLAPVDVPPLTKETMTRLLSEICPRDRWQRYIKSRDLDFAYEIPGHARFRSNYLFDSNGMCAVFRQIPNEILTMEDLNCPDALRMVSEKRQGLVFVTGPTGSGKSTTLAAMVDYINRTFSKHIITIEDPIEFVHQNQRSVIIHREVGEHSDSFAAALRSAMKGDPDIILVGEMRELETIKLALNCASMGMLVFGTLHTNSAPKTIDRVIDVFPADQQDQIRTMLAESLTAVVSQLLCRRSDGKGRVAAHEILVRTEALPNTIREGAISSIKTIIEGGATQGMCSMDGSLMALLEDDVITPMEAYMKASSKDEFAKYIEEQAGGI